MSREGSSLRTRVLLLLLLSVCAALGIAGTMLSLAAKEFHQGQAVAAFRNAQVVVGDELRRRQAALESLVSTLSADTAVVSTLNMLSNYADPNAYQPLVFDSEKRRLARELSLFAAAGDELAVLAFESGGEVAAFAERRGTESLEGIVSYAADAQPSVLIAESGAREAWNRGDYPPGIRLVRDLPLSAGRFFAITKSESRVRLVAGAPVMRFARGDAPRGVGRIIVSEPMSQIFLGGFERQTGMQLHVVADAAQLAVHFPAVADAAFLSAAPDILAEAEAGKGGWSETDEHYIQVYALVSNGTRTAYLVLSSAKGPLVAQVRHTMLTVLLAFLIAAGIVVPLGLSWGRRSVAQPVEELLASVERIGEGNYDAVPGAASGVGEFVRLSSAIREMAGTIREREAQIRLWAKVMDNSREGIIVTDAGERIVLVNNAFSRITGYSAEEAIGQTPRILKSELQPAEFFRAMWQALDESGYWQGELLDRARDGRIFPSLTSITAVRGADGRTSHYVSIFSDLTEQKEALESIRRLAQFDPLTQLPNRTLLHDRISVALASLDREGGMLAVLCLDLDRFKDVNDSLGLAAGDKLLCLIAKRLSAAIRESDTAARLAADEFVIVLTGVRRPDDAAQVAQAVIAAIGEPLQIDAQTLQVGACIGIAMAPDDGVQTEDLLRNAEAAMYHAKSTGRASYQFFTAAMNDRAQQRLRMEADLRQALAGDEFSLYYQPQIDLRSGRVYGAEALIRWHRGRERTFVPPSEFIPVAEEIGLILPIGEWVLREACRQRVRWREWGLPSFPVAVNISAVQFRQRDFAKSVLGIAQEYGIRPGEIELEVTESVVMHDPEQVASILARLKEAGFGLAIDDFGTGYSSLSYLKRFALDKLKIDASFVRDIVRDSADLAIVHAIVSLGHSLGLRLVAEGVEGPAELRVLGNMGCDIVQGYHYCRPVPAADFVAWLSAYGNGDGKSLS